MSPIASTRIDAERKTQVGSSSWTSAPAAYCPQTLMAPV
jgi:hypothetical protein